MKSMALFATGFYFLADGLYPKWAIYAKTYSNPVYDKDKAYLKVQESVRKDVECVVGILVEKFCVLAQPLQGWYLEDLQSLLHCCIILHTMVVAHCDDLAVRPYEEAAAVARANNPKKWPHYNGMAVPDDVFEQEAISVFFGRVALFSERRTVTNEHFQLKMDLKENIYNNHKGY